MQSIHYGDSLAFNISLRANGDLVGVSPDNFTGGVVDTRTRNRERIMDFGFEVIDRATIAVRLSPEQTALLAISSNRYSYYVKFTDGDYVKTVMTGTLEVLPNG